MPGHRYRIELSADAEPASPRWKDKDEAKAKVKAALDGMVCNGVRFTNVDIKRIDAVP